MDLDTKTLLITDVCLFTNYTIFLFHRGRQQGPEASWCSCALPSPGAELGGPWGSAPKDTSLIG